MRVALFAHRLATRRPTGIDRYARELIAAIAADGEHEVIAVSTSERDMPDWIPRGVEVRQVRGPRQAVHAAWSTVRRPTIDRLVGDVDLVHVTAPTFPVPTSLPVVYTVHDLMPLLHPQWFDRVHRWGFRRAVAEARDRAAAVIADSVSTADAAVAVAGMDRDRVSIVPLGVPAAFLAPVAAADIDRVTSGLGVTAKSYVVCVGHVNERKNVATLVDALARLGDARPTLVLAGPDGVGADRVRALVAMHELDAWVRFAGFVGDRDLPALVAGSRALLHPSRHEGFGLPPLEAMALGVPAVVADTTALPETVGDAALVADADDPDAWAAAIAALDDEDLTASLGDRGRVHARQFTWSRTAAETLAVYSRVATRAGRG
jgi:glycosyltransferase involved in cell wall biosynthesis